MAINTGVDVSKLVGFAVLSIPEGVDVSKVVGYAVLHNGAVLALDAPLASLSTFDLPSVALGADIAPAENIEQSVFEAPVVSGGATIASLEDIEQSVFDAPTVDTTAGPVYVSKLVGFAVLSNPEGVDVSKVVAYAVLHPGAVLALDAPLVELSVFDAPTVTSNSALIQPPTLTELSAFDEVAAAGYTSGLDIIVPEEPGPLYVFFSAYPGTGVGVSTSGAPVPTGTSGECRFDFADAGGGLMDVSLTYVEDAGTNLPLAIAHAKLGVIVGGSTFSHVVSYPGDGPDWNPSATVGAYAPGTVITLIIENLAWDDFYSGSPTNNSDLKIHARALWGYADAPPPFVQPTFSAGSVVSF